MELPNFYHLTASTILFELRDKILLVTSWAKTLTSKLFFPKMFISKRPRRAIFADIIKIVTMFNKTILKYSKTVIIIRKYIKMQSLFVFLDIAKFVDFP